MTDPNVNTNRGQDGHLQKPDVNAMTDSELRVAREPDEVRAIFARLHHYNYHEYPSEARWDAILRNAESEVNAFITAHVARVADEARQSVIDHVYAMSPTKQFKYWKPQDAAAFYERLKAYEAALTDPDKEQNP